MDEETIQNAIQSKMENKTERLRDTEDRVRWSNI